MSSRLPNPTDIVQVNSFSDGDPNHRPTDPAYVPSDPENYLRKLATKWMEQKGGGTGAGEWRHILCLWLNHAFSIPTPCSMWCFLLSGNSVFGDDFGSLQREKKNHAI